MCSSNRPNLSDQNQVCIGAKSVYTALGSDSLKARGVEVAAYNEGIILGSGELGQCTLPHFHRVCSELHNLFVLGSFPLAVVIYTDGKRPLRFVHVPEWYQCVPSSLHPAVYRSTASCLRPTINGNGIGSLDLYSIVSPRRGNVPCATDEPCKRSHEVYIGL